MIPPEKHCTIMLEATNLCHKGCSNCTRLTKHVQQPFFMDVKEFERACVALKDFPEKSVYWRPNLAVSRPKHKMVAIMGGEPLLHPEFVRLAETLERVIPRREHRGLWTGVNYKKTSLKSLINRVFGYVNNNIHNTRCIHSPVLVASREVIKDEVERKKAIDQCWLQQAWSSSITPKGFFFCEVAGALDTVLNGPGGLPVEPDCWRRPLEDFKSQIDQWCELCGISLNLEGRLDKEGVDDISKLNLEILRGLGSPRVEEGNYELFDADNVKTTDKPWRYLK